MVLDGFHGAYRQNSGAPWAGPQAICDIKGGLFGHYARGDWIVDHFERIFAYP